MAGAAALLLVAAVACSGISEPESAGAPTPTLAPQPTVSLFVPLPTPTALPATATPVPVVRVPPPTPTAAQQEPRATAVPAPTATTPPPTAAPPTAAPATEAPATAAVTATPVRLSTLPNTPVPLASRTAERPNGYLLFNQRVIEGLSVGNLNIGDVDAMFEYIFTGLPDEVTVYPSENYYYFILYTNERQFWGNIRLPAGRRELGELSFAYFEFDEFPVGQRTGLTRAKFFTADDGVFLREISPLSWDVEYKGKTVRFNFHPLRQDPPQSFPLGRDELFIERTFDESGYQFFLLFNQVHNYFFWVLNEEEVETDILEPFGDATDVLIGRKSGFAFWVDAAHGNRKILAAIRRLSVNRNDYYDGPFDQLADNYADETNVSEFMQRAYPGLRNRIDKFGYYTNQARPLRVAISAYYTYLSSADLTQFFDRMRKASDPFHFISRGGVPLQPTPTPAGR